MGTYNVRLLETRISDCEADDTAIFQVTGEDDGQDWQVAAVISPLFRVLRMTRNASLDERRDMVAGLGARGIVERLENGLPLEHGGYVVIAEEYPGAPASPEPIRDYEQITVNTKERSGSQRRRKGKE